MSTTPNYSTAPADAPAVLDFDAWLATGTVAQRTVELHNDRRIVDDLLNLDRRRQVVAKATTTGEASITEGGAEIAAIDAQYEDLYARWQASKETWVVRALSGEEVDEIKRRHPVDPMPEQPGKNSPAGARVIHETAMRAWAEHAARVRDESDLDFLSVAIVRVETALGTADHISVEQLRALRTRPGRQGDITALLKAAAEALTADVEPPAPFSQRPSEAAQA
jgi:hypothetical protein